MSKFNTPIPSLKLNDGSSMPMLSYGTGTAWYKTGDEDNTDDAMIAATKMAIEMGYYHLDGAEVYKTEQELGAAIKASKVEREKLFVTTKVMGSIGDIPNAIKTSLRKLGLDYVDLYLIHAPFFANSPQELQTAWKAMEAVKEAGQAKSIGVSNFRVSDLQTILSTASIPPSCNQIEFHPYCQQPKLLAFHKAHNIATSAYAPLTSITKAAPGPLDNYLPGIAKKYAVSPGEILLRWCIDQDVVPITTSGKEQRLSDYLRAATFKLTPKEVEDIKGLGAKKQYRGFFASKFEGA